MDLTIETEIEEDGRWIAEVLEIPGVLAYGKSELEATGKVKALALRVLAERLEYGESTLGIEKLFRLKRGTNAE